MTTQPSSLFRYFDSQTASFTRPNSTPFCSGERVSDAVAMAVAFAGNFPFWTFSQKFAGPVAGPIMGACNLAGFGIFRGKCLMDLFDRCWGRVDADERAIVSQSGGGCTQLKRVGAVLAGIAAQAPIMYLAYEYNGRNLLYPIIVGCAESAPSILSSLWSVEGAGCAARDHELELFREALIQRVEQFRSELPRWARGMRVAGDSCEERFRRAIGWIPKEFVDGEDAFIAGVMDRARGPDKAIAMLDLATASAPVRRERSTADRSLEWAVGGFGAILGLYTLTLYGRVSYGGVREWGGDEVLAGAAAGVTVAANALITGKFTVDAAQNFYRGIRDVVRGEGDFPLAQALSPRAWVLLRCAALAMAWGAFGPTGYVSREDFPSPVRDVFVSFAPFAAAFLILAILPQIFDEGIRSYYLHRGSQRERAYVQLDRGLSRFSSVLARANPEKVRAFRDGLDPRLGERFGLVAADEEGINASLLSEASAGAAST